MFLLILDSISSHLTMLCSSIMSMFALFTLFMFTILHSFNCQEIDYTYPQVFYKDTILHIKLNAFGTTFVLDLKENHFLSNSYREYPSKTINDLQHNIKKTCHYVGSVINTTQSWVAISYCDHLLNGIFEADGVVYHLQQHDANDNVKIFTKTKIDRNLTCGVKDDLKSTRKRRSLRHDLDFFNQTRYVELVIVNDYDLFQKYGKKTEFIFEQTKQIANIVNALYSPLNIKIVLVGAVVWTEKNEINITNDSSQTLNNFLEYRRKVLLKMFPNDNAQLITASSFENGIVGKALKQTLCTYEYSGGVNSFYTDSLSLIATTIAHEMGHNFGLEHDKSNCSCPSKSCIMGASSTFPSPKHWSSCSIRQFEESFTNGIDNCLFNKPRLSFKSSCGDGIIDQGEECDCGLPEFCKNPCCNATTCKLNEKAECAHGDCCNTTTCKIITKDLNHVCRQNVSICDLTEKCDGTSENCPKDRYIKDGTECNEGYSYCFNGKCDSRESQCNLLWGNAAKVAKYKCFQHNLNASSTGNCGYNKENKRYVDCESPKDIICGRLHCTSQSEKLQYGPEGATIIMKSKHQNGKIVCLSAIIDFGLDNQDPGLVPNGVKCAFDSMCVNQKCVPVNRYLMNKPCPYNCNNNGYCDNEGQCQCYDGTSSYDCGSSRYIFTIAIYILFFIIFPILSLSAFIFYTKKEKIKSWLCQRKLISREYSNKKDRKIISKPDISSPIVYKETSFPVSHEPPKPVRPAPPPPKGISLPNQYQFSKSQDSTIPSRKIRPNNPPPPVPPHATTADTNINENVLKVKDLIKSFDK